MQSENLSSTRSWDEILGPYKRTHWGKSLFQLSNSVILFGLGWWAMLKSLEISYLLALLIAFPTAGCLIRLFIIQHDCGHGAYFKSRKLENLVGFLIGVIMLTPYHYWRRTHAMHHASSGDLDRRDFGEIETITVREYQDRSLWGRFRYRFYRHPLVFLVIGPIYQFVFKHRLPVDTPLNWKKEWASVWLTNAGIAAILLLVWQTIGFKAFLMVQIPITLIASSFGVWLFYIQHQFEDTYWRRSREWNFHQAGIQGSSFYDLPKVLHWFTGNIGFHHVHHLSSRIPNYRLRECLEANPELHQVTKLSFRESLGCVRLKLWDEDQKKLVGFGDLRAASRG